MEHFGINFRKSKYSFKLQRDEFALINTKPSLPFSRNLIQKKAYTDNTCSQYSEQWCKEYRELCLKNYDINMNYYNNLNSEDFNRALNKFLDKFKCFHEIDNLNNVDSSGFYIMVLDEYKQVYIGQSVDIKKRIRQHWSATKSFDKTLYPMYAWKNSVFSIDFFRCLDTTRIFIWEYDDVDDFNKIEEMLVENFPSKYLTNRIGGGDGRFAQFKQITHKFEKDYEVPNLNTIHNKSAQITVQRKKSIFNKVLDFLKM